MFIVKFVPFIALRTDRQNSKLLHASLINHHIVFNKIYWAESSFEIFSKLGRNEVIIKSGAHELDNILSRVSFINSIYFMKESLSFNM